MDRTNTMVKENVNLTAIKYVKTLPALPLDAVDKLVDYMCIRLEEFQTMIHLIKQEIVSTDTTLRCLCDSRDDLSNLFERTDQIQCLVDNMKSNLGELENLVEKAEEEFCYPESTVTKILTPLFKRSF